LGNNFRKKFVQITDAIRPTPVGARLKIITDIMPITE
jgi:hypothetical protein